MTRPTDHQPDPALAVGATLRVDYRGMRLVAGGYAAAATEEPPPRGLGIKPLRSIPLWVPSDS